MVAGLLIGSAINGHSPRSFGEWLAPVGPAVTVAVAGLWVFDRWAWCWPAVHRLHGRPVLQGTWHGELASSYVNPETGEQIDPDPDVFLVIRQRFWSVYARLLTKESSSESLLAEFTAGPDGVCQLVYVYVNQPQAAVQHRSAAHFGAVVLSAPRRREDGVEGQYFTGRGTKGDMRFRAHYSELVESHAAGRALVAAQPRPGPEPGRGKD